MLACLAAGAFAADPPKPISWERPNIPPAASAPPALPPVSAPGTLPTLSPSTPPPVALPAPGKTVAFTKPPGSTTTTTAPVPVPTATTPVSIPPVVAPSIPKLPQIADLPPNLMTEIPRKDLPISRDKLFRLESDKDVEARIRRELEQESRKDGNEKGYDLREPLYAAYYPKGVPYQTKAIREAYPPAKSLIAADYVVHRRLYFEEKNAERYGWDMGILQPVVSTAMFYKDTLLWPLNLASHTFERYDTSAGTYYAGSPVPYFLYPPEIDLFGFGVGGAVIAGAAVILP